MTEKIVLKPISTSAIKLRLSKFLIESRKIEEQLLKMSDLSGETDKLIKFLELVKNLAGLYQIANPSEKRLIVELTTSNRFVDRKTVELQASNWLSTVDNVTTVLCGGASRDTDRTHPEEQERQLGFLQEAQCEVLADDQLERLMAIFERHLGSPSQNSNSKDSK